MVEILLIRVKTKRRPICKVLSHASQSSYSSSYFSAFHQTDHYSDIFEFLLSNYVLFTVFRWPICVYHVSNILKSLL